MRVIPAYLVRERIEALACASAGCCHFLYERSEQTMEHEMARWERKWTTLNHQRNSEHPRAGSHPNISSLWHDGGISRDAAAGANECQAAPHSHIKKSLASSFFYPPACAALLETVRQFSSQIKTINMVPNSAHILSVTVIWLEWIITARWNGSNGIKAPLVAPAGFTSRLKCGINFR